MDGTKGPASHEQLETLAARYAHPRNLAETLPGVVSGETERVQDERIQDQHDFDAADVQLIKACMPLLDELVARCANSSEAEQHL